MTACERATAGPEAAVMVEATPVSQQATVASSFHPQAWRAGVLQFVDDVVRGMRRVSHNALAMLGLMAVVGVVFLAGRPDVRYRLEHQTLGWLTDRATSRAMAIDDAEGGSEDILLAMAEPEAIQRATARRSARALGAGPPIGPPPKRGFDGRWPKWPHRWPDCACAAWCWSHLWRCRMSDFGCRNLWRFRVSDVGFRGLPILPQFRFA